MDRDPIIDSSPMRLVNAGRRAVPETYDSADDSGDDLFEEQHFTEATIPLPGVQSSYFNRKPNNSTPFVTQPTQILSSPNATRTDTNSVVQVAASSPAIQRPSPSPMPQPSPLISAMAPPGTFLRRPISYVRPVVQIDLDLDDPPVEDDSEEDEITTRSNIKPSVFKSRKAHATRVEETPQKKSLDLSHFVFNGLGAQKRSAVDDLASAYAGPPRKRQQLQQARQVRPSRAKPVQADIELDDIPDFTVRRNVERMKALAPDKTYLELQDALAAKKGNYSDAMDLIFASEESIVISDHELSTTPAKTVAAKPTAKREIKAAKTIHEKFSNITASQAPADTLPKKRRLVQGRKNRSPSPIPTPKQLKRPIDTDEDEDSGVASASESEAEEEEPRDDSRDGRLLHFFNTCSEQELVDLSNQNAEIISYVLSKRPFKSLDAVRGVVMESQPSNNAKGKSRRTKAKPVGESLLNFSETMWAGYEAVDELCAKCKALGIPIAAEMEKWGVNVFGVSNDGGVDLVTLDDANSESNSSRDSGLGTPRSAVTDDNDLDVVVVKSHRKKPSFLKKPSNMAKDLELKNYQLVGLNWLYLLFKNQMSGILADDMGLGKTVQVIALISQLNLENIEGPHLIVVPGSTLENWLREFNKFSPELVVEPYYGSEKARASQRVEILRQKASIDAIVTTYDLAYKKEDNKFLRKCNPVVCVFDEGHTLKNGATKKYKELMRIQAEFRLLLTGTPLQNNLQELASILSFIMPDLFKELEEELSIVFKHKAKTTDGDHAALLSAQRVDRARKMIAPFVLRRKKAQVLKDLPKKICRVEYCELTPSQQQLYDKQLERQRKVLEDRAKGILVKDHANVMMQLRQAAIHPLLFRSIYDDDTLRKMSRSVKKEETFKDTDPDVVLEELEFYSDHQLHIFSMKYPTHMGKYALNNEEWMDSGKVKKLSELLIKFKRNGDRTLIFSQFTQVMDILEWVLDTLGMSFFRLDGTTPIPSRQDMFDEFYRDESIPALIRSSSSILRSIPRMISKLRTELTESDRRERLRLSGSSLVEPLRNRSMPSAFRNWPWIIWLQVVMLRRQRARP